MLLLVTRATAGYAGGRVGLGVTGAAVVVPFACSFGLFLVALRAGARGVALQMDVAAVA